MSLIANERNHFIMKKGDIYQGTVEYVDFPNKAYVAIESDDENNGKKIIVKNSIPNQKIEFMINKKKKDKCEGRLIKVLEKSPLETVEPCEYFGICGGCVYQTMEYEKQVQLKEKQVKDILDKVINNNYEFQGIISSPISEAYRNKMEYSFGDEIKEGPLALGLHKRNTTYDIVSVNSCKIVHNDFNMILMTVLDYFKEKNIPYLHKVTHKGYLRHLLVRRATKTEQILVDIVTTTQLQYDMTELGEILKKLPLTGKIVGFLHTFNDTLADVVKNESTKIIYGRDYIEEELLGLTFKISTFSFFQTNSLGAEKLYLKAREYLGVTKDKIVFDLYSGTGTIAQILAPFAQKVIGVEIVEEAVESAKMNAVLNGLNNCEFIADDVLKALDNITDKPDLVVLDPPRDGLHPKALKKIGEDFNVSKMIYISCKPTSLARDLVELQKYGYEVVQACCVDMFPGTVHIETVCLLSKLDVEHHIEVEIDLDEMDLTAAESKATYEEIKGYVKENMGLHVSNLYIAQVKRKCGIIERDNYNKAKTENSKQPQCPLEKEKAIKAALRYFGMI